MLFRQRNKKNIWEHLRLWIWPRRSFSRSMLYIGKRIIRISATPHSIALGLSIGIFISFTPLYGLHIVVSIFFAWMLSANIAASIIGTAVSNPITIPIIFSATYEVGYNILDFIKNYTKINNLFTFNEIYTKISIIILQLFLGSIILGTIFSVIAYILTLRITKRFHEKRNRRKILQNFLFHKKIK